MDHFSSVVDTKKDVLSHNKSVQAHCQQNEYRALKSRPE
ncbi:hypothetical protein EcB7A_4172 [Escherichia coli B7A]|nr:hypothetical protein L960_4665 [Escherichia coli B7A]EDV64153.1 hypothetical protein EcB7A_4172 [Escherichia coli B7A]OMI58657.1 hypothetical protein Q676_04470 [Escherichia coli N40607]DAR51883.1 MAG TPA: hypothetical protein [Caudoviricetes sp.]DAU79516.1 MAG TPA: hypothetical protein [Caudoviricetes sp.]